METATREKRCKVCGTDVSKSKRTKDAAGSYYCEPCVQAHQRRPGVSATDGKTCENCGAATGALQRLSDWNGHRVCITCRSALEQEQSERVAAEEVENEARAAAAQQEENAAQRVRESQESNRNSRLKALSSGAVCFGLGLVSLLGAAFVLVRDGSTARQSDTIGLVSVIVTPLFLFGFAVPAIMRYRRLAAEMPDVNLRTDLVVAFGRTFGTVFVVGFIFALILVPFMGAGLGAMIVGLIVGPESVMSWIGIIAGLIVGGMISLFLFFYAREIELGKCPNCGRVFKSVVEGRTHVGQQTVTTRDHETATVHEGFGTYGKVLQTIRMPVTRSRTFDVYRVHRQCTACGHRWTR